MSIREEGEGGREGKESSMLSSREETKTDLHEPRRAW